MELGIHALNLEVEAIVILHTTLARNNLFWELSRCNATPDLSCLYSVSSP